MHENDDRIVSRFLLALGVEGKEPDEPKLVQLSSISSERLLDILASYPNYCVYHTWTSVLYRVFLLYFFEKERAGRIVKSLSARS